MSEHTPGRWEVSGGRYVVAFGESGGNVCVVGEPRRGRFVEYAPLEIGSKDAEEAYANARLIAAAPELLSTWRDYIDLWNVRHENEGCPEDDTCECPLVARINAAILKAEGR